MFEHFKTYVGVKVPSNRFWPVPLTEIEHAEQWQKMPLPSQLRAFYVEVGKGFWVRGVRDEHGCASVINRVLGPLEAVDMLSNADNELRPDEGFAQGVFPFFDIGESTYFVVKPHSNEPNIVYWPDGVAIVSESVEEFFSNLYQSAVFYRQE